MNPQLKAAALRYAAKGWPVFLLGRSKRPVANCANCSAVQLGHDAQACPCLTCHGLYSATREPKRIAAMLAAVPAPMLAIRTGAASGLVVVDIDPKYGGLDTLAALVDEGLTPPTSLVRTGSGGLHLYYLHPGEKVPCSQGRLGPGVDVRGDGGYVVAPPSVHPATREPYQWAGHRAIAEMPPALVQACRPNQPATCTHPASPVHTRAGGGITSPARLLAALLEAVAQAPQGKRRTTLYGAARGVARMVAAGAISHTDAWTALAQAGRQAEQTERETRAAIAGGFRDEGVTP